jgi:hypothetical protein
MLEVNEHHVRELSALKAIHAREISSLKAEDAREVSSLKGRHAMEIGRLWQEIHRLQHQIEVIARATDKQESDWPNFLQSHGKSQTKQLRPI